jgi:hypothetical protein
MNTAWKRRRLGLGKKRAAKPRPTIKSKKALPFVAMNRGRGRGVLRVQTGDTASLLQTVTARIAAAKEANDKNLISGLNDNLQSQSKRFENINRLRNQDREVISAMAFNERQRSLIAEINDDDTDPARRRLLIKQLREDVQRPSPASAVDVDSSAIPMELPEVIHHRPAVQAPEKMDTRAEKPVPNTAQQPALQPTEKMDTKAEKPVKQPAALRPAAAPMET